MISEAELRRIAGRQGADPMLVDLDYALGCFLASLFRRAEAAALCFKGGTCLRKGYYADYRYSEDLDFTLTERMGREALLPGRLRLPVKTVRFAARKTRRPSWGDRRGDRRGQESAHPGARAA